MCHIPPIKTAAVQNWVWNLQCEQNFGVFLSQRRLWRFEFWFIKFKRKWRNQTACSCWRRLNWSQNSERGSSFRCGGSEWLSGDRVCVRPESSDRLWGLFLPAVSLPIDQCEGCSYKYLTGTSTESVLFILLILKHIS